MGIMFSVIFRKFDIYYIALSTIVGVYVGFEIIYRYIFSGRFLCIDIIIAFVGYIFDRFCIDVLITILRYRFSTCFFRNILTFAIQCRLSGILCVIFLICYKNFGYFPSHHEECLCENCSTIYKERSPEFMCMSNDRCY